MDVELINTLFQLLTGLTFHSLVFFDVCLCASVATQTMPSQPNVTVDLFKCYVKNPILLPSIFYSLRGTPCTFRAQVLKSLYEVLGMRMHRSLALRSLLMMFLHYSGQGEHGRAGLVTGRLVFASVCCSS